MDSDRKGQALQSDVHQKSLFLVHAATSLSDFHCNIVQDVPDVITPDDITHADVLGQLLSALGSAE